MLWGIVLALLGLWVAALLVTDWGDAVHVVLVAALVVAVLGRLRERGAASATRPPSGPQPK